MSEKRKTTVKPEPTSAKKRTGRARQESNASDEEEDFKVKGSKRARKQAVADDEEEEEEEGGDEDMDAPGAEGQPFERDENGYVTGSIVRITLKNFVTYDYVSFCPGPDLNMILGPNGTGKSSIACAIALGLGFPAKVLGRSTAVSAFVKSGEQSGSIEIELKGLSGKENVVVKRNLKSSDDTTTYELNGKSSTLKEVSEKMRKLNVQVGNLCTFLPQDRVVAFAKLSSSELLEETQKAAGDPRLSDWHKSLIAQRIEAKGLETEATAARRKLVQLEKVQTGQEAQVADYQRRQKIQDEIDILEVLLPFAEYNAVRDEVLRLKDARTLLKNELRELEAANKPFKDSHTALEGIVKHFEGMARPHKVKKDKLGKEMTSRNTALVKCIKDSDKIRDDLKSVTTDENHRQRTLKDLVRKVEKSRQSIEKKPAEPDLTDVNTKLRNLNSKRVDLLGEVSNLEAEEGPFHSAMKDSKRDEGRVNAELRNLQSVAGRRDQNCRQYDADTWKAVEWLRQNTHKFKGTVYEPARLTVKAKSQRDVRLAEAPLTMNAFKTFVFEYQVDYDHFMRETADKNRWRVNGAFLGQGRTLASYPREFSDDQLRDWGFDCLAIDLIEGPDLVLAYLCSVCNLHKTPVALKPNARLKTQEIESTHRVSRYYTPEGSNSVRVSRYGAKHSQVEQRFISDPKILTLNLETEKIKECEKKLERILALRNESTKQWDEVIARKNQTKEDINGIAQQKAELEKEKEQLQKPMRTWISNKARHDVNEAELAGERRKPSSAAKKAKLKTDLLFYAEKRCQLALELKDLTMRTVRHELVSVACELQRLQAESDLRAMATSSSELDQEMNEKAQELEAVTLEHSQQTARGKEIQGVAEGMIGGASQDVVTEVTRRREAENPAVEDVERDLNQKRAELEASGAALPAQFIREYEARKAQIAISADKVQSSDAKLAEANQAIKEIENQWLPKLSELVGAISVKFAAAFDRMGLLGEIRIAKDEDYAKWGVEILVSFRDGEEMSVLSSHRQSGGERALTTVMYLMSLAELAKAPFALVDEINQGMDQRVERLVHNALVATTCKDDVGQYFLITPKLLPGLNYHPRMKVLIINNGDWLPEKLSLTDLVANKLGSRNKRPAALAH